MAHLSPLQLFGIGAAFVATAGVGVYLSLPAAPLAESIVGEWELWCRSDDPTVATCLGRDDDGMFKRFSPDGNLVSGSVEGSSMRGRWSLKDERLTLRFEGAGMQIEEHYDARIEDERLVLWFPSGGFGAIYGRKGADFAATDARVADTVKSGSIETTIDSDSGPVRLSITLPAGYRMTRDDNQRQRWGPSSGDGLVVNLSISPRVRGQVNGQWVPAPCSDYDDASVLGGGKTVDGVERRTSIGTSICLQDSENALSCSVEHTRGYLLDADDAPALALCRSLQTL